MGHLSMKKDKVVYGFADAIAEKRLTTMLAQIKSPNKLQIVVDV
jgi:hypothetical protein